MEGIGPSGAIEPTTPTAPTTAPPPQRTPKTGQEDQRQGAAGIKRAGDRIVGYKGSQQYKDLTKLRDKANDEVLELDKRYNAMQAQADAARRGDGPAQVALIANFIKSIVGGQGVRVTQTEWNQAVGNAPFIERFGAHFTAQGVYGFSTSPLSSSQVDQYMASVKSASDAAHGKVAQYDLQIQQQVARDTGQQPPATPPGQGAPGTKENPIVIRPEDLR
jgi:hypothetical protein